MAEGAEEDNLHTPPPQRKPFNIRLPPSGRIASLLILTLIYNVLTSGALTPAVNLCSHLARGQDWPARRVP
nr:hypothetical protein BaRGS_017755 [Batillaria attramentaria]